MPPPESERLLSRLDNASFNRKHTKLLFQGGLGIMFDGLDSSAIAFALPAVIVLYHISSPAVGALASASLIGGLAGTVISGTLGDLIGRKKVMSYALAVYSVASFAAAFSPSSRWLFVFRVLAGVGAGAESAIIPPFVAELIPARYRGRFVGSVTGFFAFGYVLAALLGIALVPNFHSGWRYLLFLCGLPVVMLLWWRRSVPESPRWLLKHGRVDQAALVVDELTGPAPADPAALASHADPVVDVPVQNVPLLSTLLLIWSRPYWKRTLMSWVLWFAVAYGNYSLVSWLPTLLIHLGVSETTGFTYTLIIYAAQIPGFYSAAWLCERLDRKWAAAIYLVFAAVGCLFLSHAKTGTEVLVSGAILDFFVIGAFGIAYIYTPELYPTEVRATANGLSNGMGRLGGILAPIMVGALIDSAGVSGVYTVTMIVLLVAIAVMLTLGPRTSTRSLEETSTSAEELAGPRIPVDAIDHSHHQGA